VDNNTEASLDLYASIEDMLENEEAIAYLYRYYYLALEQLSPSSLLDVGCGSGAFLQSVQTQFRLPAKGIDLSGVMVQRAAQKGLNVQTIDLCDEPQCYGAITAVFDMLNYLPPEALQPFLACVVAHLEEGGYFIFDINTAFGFENVAVGAYSVEDESRFLAIESAYENKKYDALFTLFHQTEEGCYTKSQERLFQYLHSVEEIVSLSGMQLVFQEPIALYDLEEADKYFVVLQKVAS